MSALIEAFALRREYDGAPAVDDVSFRVETGAVFALVGPNGAGKTTLLRMLAALLEPTSGTAMVCGHDVIEAPREVHACLGFLPDFYGLYGNLQVGEYLRYFHRAYRLPEDRVERRVAETLERVGLGPKAGAAVDELSRGMRQKLSLARALLHDPPVLLLDEPAAGLDPGARHDMQVLLTELASKGKTIIVSSHILSELEDYCTHVAILDRGRMAFAGSLAEARRTLGKGRRMMVRALSGAPEARALLAAHPGVSGVDEQGEEICFSFAGDDAAAAALLKALVDGKVAVAAFGDVEGAIQDAYLSMLGGRE